MSCAKPAQKRMNRNDMTNPEVRDTAATVAEPGAHVAPEKAPSKKGASQRKGAPKAKKTAKAAGPKKDAKAPRQAHARKGAEQERSNKKAEVIGMMRRAKGATVEEIIAVTTPRGNATL